MSPRKNKAAKDKKKKNLKNPSAEDLFTADWPALSLQSSKGGFPLDLSFSEPVAEVGVSPKFFEIL
jgi:hypothetical protein